MPRASIQNKIASGEYPSKDDFVEYYIEQNHSQTDTAVHFHITRPIVQSLISFWGIVKNAESISKINSTKALSNSRSVSYKVSSGEYPGEKEFKKYYIDDGHCRKDTADHFNISESAVTSLLNYYGIHKNSNEVSETRKKTCTKKYGVSSNLQLDECKDMIKNTCLKKYGVEHISQAECVKEKVRNTFISKYGVERIFRNKEALEKVRQTNIEKWCIELLCQHVNSKPNPDFEEKLISVKCDYSCEYPLGKYSYDFKVGDVLIEIDPWYTHQSSFENKYGKKDKMYHCKKSEFAIDNGLHCVHVFDWDDQDKIVNLFLKKKDKCYARDCSINRVDKDEEIAFLNKYHLQGYIKSGECLGLYHEGKLVQVMSFGTPRYNKTYDYELLRLCSSETVVGGSEKLFKYFTEEHPGASIISYCDLSKFNGNVYEKLGFKLLRKSISKHWYSPKLKKHITDNLLRQHGFDRLLGKLFGCSGKGTSNDVLMLEHGFVEIYDAGQASYIYK